MGERRGTKALELWCRRITEGYPGVNVQNMTTSWKDGLAFCAMIHHFRPDLIEFERLNKEDVYGNNELAFRTAEQHLGIPALLDAEDMASCQVPDRLSILTYLSQFYQTFGGSSPSRLAVNRTTETSSDRIAPVPVQVQVPVSDSPKQKVGSRLGLRRDPCASCGLPVFLAEKLVVSRLAYHRTCFRCARCRNQLTPGNYYETESGEFCCEACPDEVALDPAPTDLELVRTEEEEEAVELGVPGPLSDEEKSRKRILDTTVPDLIAQTSQLRLNFIASHLLNERKDDQGQGHSVDGQGQIVDGLGYSVEGQVQRPDMEEQRPIIEGEASRLDDREPGLDGPGSRLNDREQGLDGPVSRLDDREPGLNGPGSRLNDREQGLDGQVSRIDGRESRMDGLRSKSDGQERGSRVNDRESRMGDQASRMDRPGSRENGSGSRTDGLGSAIDDRGSRSRDSGIDGLMTRIDDPESRTDGLGLKTAGQGSKADGPRFRTDGPGSIIDDEVQKSEGLRVHSAIPDDDDDDDEVVEEEDEDDEGDVEDAEEEDYEEEDRGSLILSSVVNSPRATEEPTAIKEDDTKEAPLSLVQRRLRMFEVNDIPAKEESKVSKLAKDPPRLARTSEKESTDPSNQPELVKGSVDLKEESADLIRTSVEPVDLIKASIEAQREPIYKEGSIDSKRESAESMKKTTQPTKGAQFARESMGSAKKRQDSSRESIDSVKRSGQLIDSVKRTREPIDSVKKTKEPISSTKITAQSTKEPMDSTKKLTGPIREPIDSMKSRSQSSKEPVDSEQDYPEDLNPFKSDEDDEEPEEEVSSEPTDLYQTALDSSRSSKHSTNPFDESGSDGEPEEVVPRPATRTTAKHHVTAADQARVMAADDEAPMKRRLAAPQINLNPFWSDEEEEEEEALEDSDLESKERTSAKPPVPKPRTIKHTPELGMGHRKSELNRSGIYASNSSISSESTSTPGGTYRKKKPAPPPPMANELFPKSSIASPQPQGVSPRTMPRARKTKPAPPPPMQQPITSSTPYSPAIQRSTFSFEESPISELGSNPYPWEDQKTSKDQTNRNRQSLNSYVDSYPVAYPDKSVQGKWKRKKGPAPPRPIPHRRKIKVMSMKDVKLELDEIEMQQQGLERQGVRLEQLIRDKCESGARNEDSCLAVDVEELVLELFALVNEKNELFRRQAELMLLRRQQRLEEEHAEVEYQIRCLMSQPEATKTDFDKQREEALIQRLVEIVERRNEIVECLEMDRRREVEEDRSINKHMGLFAARNKTETSLADNDAVRGRSRSTRSTMKEKSKDKKSKEKKSRRSGKKDADKDVDEAEAKLKRGRRKWF